MTRLVPGRSYVLVIFQFLVIGLAACTEWGRQNVGPWREEVDAPGASGVIVEREETIDIEGPIGESKAAITRSAALTILGSDGSATPRLETPNRPLVLGKDPVSGQWFVITYNDRTCWDPVESGRYDETRRINLHPNTEYRLAAGTWRETDLPPDHVGLATNLLLDLSAKREAAKLERVITLGMKRERGFDAAEPRTHLEVVGRLVCG